MKFRELIINKFSYEHVGGVETVVRSYADYSCCDRIVWIAYPDSSVSSISLKRVHKKKIGLIAFPSSFKFAGHLFSLQFVIFLLFFVESFDVVHHQSPFPLGAMGSLFSTTIKKRLITFHAPILNKGLIGKAVSVLENLNRRRADLVIYTSARLMRNYSKAYQKNAVVPLGAKDGIDQIKFSKLDSGDQDRPYLLYLGRVAPYKGVPLLIEAFSKSKICKNFDLRVVGEIDKRVQIAIDDLPEFIKIEPRFVTETEKYNLISDAYFGVLASVNDGEAFGIIQLEFMALSCPVLNSFLATGVPEISLDGVTGFTCRANDLTDLILKLDAIADLSIKKYNIMRERARGRFDKQFAHSVVFNRYQSIMNSLLIDGSEMK